MENATNTVYIINQKREVNAGWHLLYSLPFIQKQSPRGVFQERCSTFSQFTGERPCRSVSSLTLLYGYSSKNMKHICSKTTFLEKTSGELIL